MDHDSGSSAARFTRRLLGSLLVAALAFVATQATDAITFTGSGVGNDAGETNSAPVTFSLFTSGNISNLMIDLTNTAQYKPNDPADILTAVFFSINGDPTLTRVSAVLSTGSMVVDIGTNAQPADGIVGGEWAYAADLSGAPHGANQRISAAGFNLFGPTICSVEAAFPVSAATRPLAWATG
jgi:hypothetical protein